jgi:TPP-dependent pyruvate/acetoin dehydrogenase alpha subunit
MAATTKKGQATRRRASDAKPADRELYLRMFRTMALHRAVEDRMVSMHWHEAISVGAASTLRTDDYMAPIHRDLGAHLWRGMEPWQVMASFLGKETAPTGGRDGTLHYGRLDLNVYNPPSHIPDNYPVATGGAFAFKYRGEDRVAIAYCGDGSTSRGDFHEAVNIAAVLDLGCIFIVENNQYAYSTPLNLQSRTDFASKAAAYGIPGEKVDGTDVEAVYEATKRAADRGRAGEGPTLIEAVTMRMHGHAEHDPADYVPPQMFEEWLEKDPVELFAKRLLELEFATQDEIDQIRAEVRQKAIEARKKVLSDPMPDGSNVEVGVYAD